MQSRHEARTTPCERRRMGRPLRATSRRSLRKQEREGKPQAPQKGLGSSHAGAPCALGTGPVVQMASDPRPWRAACARLSIWTPRSASPVMRCSRSSSLSRKPFSPLDEVHLIIAWTRSVAGCPASGHLINARLRQKYSRLSVPPKSVMKFVESTRMMSPARCPFGGIQMRQLNSLLPAAVKGCGRSRSMG